VTGGAVVVVVRGEAFGPAETEHDVVSTALAARTSSTVRARDARPANLSLVIGSNRPAFDDIDSTRYSAAGPRGNRHRGSLASHLPRMLLSR
jgi:hypothetical protein